MHTLESFANPVTEIQEVCQIPVEMASIRVLLPLLLYKVIKSLSLEKAQCKNNSLPR